MLDIECGAVWNGNWEGVWLGRLWISFITCLGIGAPLDSRDPPYYPPPTPDNACSAACSAACYSSTTQHGPVGRGGSSPVLAFHRTASLREPRKSQPTLLCWPLVERRLDTSPLSPLYYSLSFPSSRRAAPSEYAKQRAPSGTLEVYDSEIYKGPLVGSLARYTMPAREVTT